MAEAELSQDASELETGVVPETSQEPSEPLAKFVIPGLNLLFCTPALMMELM